MWYLYMAAGTGIICELARPTKNDDISMWKKIMIPTAAGLLWPVMLVWLIVVLIKDKT